MVWDLSLVIILNIKFGVCFIFIFGMFTLKIREDPSDLLGGSSTIFFFKGHKNHHGTGTQNDIHLY